MTVGRKFYHSTDKTIWAWTFPCGKVFNYKLNFFNGFSLMGLRLFWLFCFKQALVDCVFQRMCTFLLVIKFRGILLFVIVLYYSSYM